MLVPSSFLLPGLAAATLLVPGHAAPPSSALSISHLNEYDVGQAASHVHHELPKKAIMDDSNGNGAVRSFRIRNEEAPSTSLVILPRMDLSEFTDTIKILWHHFLPIVSSPQTINMMSTMISRMQASLRDQSLGPFGKALVFTYGAFRLALRSAAQTLARDVVNLFLQTIKDKIEAGWVGLCEIAWKFKGVIYYAGITLQAAITISVLTGQVAAQNQQIPAAPIDWNLVHG